MNDNLNFFLAIALSLGILAGWHYLYEAPRQQAAQERAQAVEVLQKEKVPEVEKTYSAPRKHDEVVAATPRLPFGNEKIKGSINLRGGRVDDLTLTRYRQTIDPNSPNIVLLSPAGSAPPYSPFYAEFGWLSNEGGLALPVSDTVWKAEGGPLAPGSDVTLRWDNGAGLSFERVISLDKDYAFKVVDRVRNASGHDVTLYPFGLISRHGTPHTLGFSVLHEGPLGVLNNTLREKNYKDLRDKPLVTEESTGGWIGITDVYWLAALIAEPTDKFTGRFLHRMVGPEERFQSDIQKAPVTVKSGGEALSTFHLFAGGKELIALDTYKDTLHAPMFDRAIDFGWFYFIAKPFFQIIDWLGRMVGNYGLAIIIFTIALRLLFYPMSESSYRNMERMKILKPQMDKLKERYGNDHAKLNQEVTALYKKENLNPLAGCLPVLIQIPVFFALYKVLLVAIEMRHAPFYSWIKDLSAPDPSNLFTLFGLVPWDNPSWLHMGALPLLMGITMFIQQKLSPPPGDKTTQQIFMWMPVMFTFLLVNMSAGLVIYWTFSNVLAIAQQVLIKHRIKPKAGTA